MLLYKTDVRSADIDHLLMNAKEHSRDLSLHHVSCSHVAKNESVIYFLSNGNARLQYYTGLPTCFLLTTVFEFVVDSLCTV